MRAATAIRLLLATGAYSVSALGFALSATSKLFSISDEMAAGKALSADATRVESVRSAFASAGGIILTAVSILPAIGAKTDVDMASSAIAIIMPP